MAAGPCSAWPRIRRRPRRPGAFMTQLVEEIAGNDYATAWQTLHPAQQRIATQYAYVACESQSPIPGKLSSVKVVDVADEDVQVAGEGTTAGKAVRVKLSITGLGDPVVLTHPGTPSPSATTGRGSSHRNGSPSTRRAAARNRKLESPDASPRARHRARLRRAAARLRPLARRAPEHQGADRERALRRPAQLRPADHRPGLVV